jgi:hypothetical protein
VRKSGRRVSGARVGSACIKDVGAPGRGKRRIQRKYELRKGALGALGYDVDDAERDRRAALRKAYAGGHSKVNLVGMLNAQYVYRKNAPRGSEKYKRARRFKADRDYVSAL